MPVDYYPNKSIADLQAILEGLQKRQSQGAISEVTAAGVRVVRSHASQAGNTKTDVELLRVLYSLYRRALGTEEAPNFPNPYASRMTRTRAAYTE